MSTLIMKVKRTQKNEGFTLIELMIATALFVIIAVIALSAILSSNVAYKKTDDMRAITDNLTFALEDMSRNLKVGYNYSCDLETSSGVLSDCPYSSVGGNSGNSPSASVGFVPFDVITLPGDPNDISTMQGYLICDSEETLSTGGTTGSLYKITENVTSGVSSPNCSSLDSLSNMVRLTDPRVHLSYLQSGFFVANTAVDDNRQPYVTMVLVGEIVTKGVVTPFAIQTTVTQRQFGK